MPKMKIEIRKPQYLAAKESAAKVPDVKVQGTAGGKGVLFFFRFLLVATYALSGLAIWFVYQKYSAQS